MAKLNIKKNKFGKAPQAEQIKKNLDEPEFVSNSPKQKKINKKIDGRNLRKTDFTEQLNIKVPEKFKQEFFQLSKDTGMTLGKLLVEIVNFYKENNQSK